MMQTGVIGKKTYERPSVSLIGSLAVETRTGDLIHKIKELGPGDQFFLTDPPTCLDYDWYSNCEETSA